MRRVSFTPRTIVLLYFAGCAALWAGLAATAMGPLLDVGGWPADAAACWLLLEFAVLALHAAAVFLLAWKLPRWLFGHGGVAVLLCALPLLFLVPAVWIVPALLYAIGVGYVWEASRRERPGQLQASPRRRDRDADWSKPDTGNADHMFG